MPAGLVSSESQCGRACSGLPPGLGGDGSLVHLHAVVPLDSHTIGVSFVSKFPLIGRTPVTSHQGSFELNHHLKGPVSEYSHSQRYWVLGVIVGVLRGTVQSIWLFCGDFLQYHFPPFRVQVCKKPSTAW